ncbi:MAG: PQQ-dependent sugar dehydrogenase [Acidimicrobiia bacterium]|nr:PQQ-dependent sugar dehydrogenase [Acidimicrobiia bacterium]
MRRIATGLVTVVLVATVTTAVAVADDTVGLVDPSTGIWNLRDDLGSTFSFYFGNPADLPFAGDWDCDGIDTPGLYRQSDGYVYLRNSNTQGTADVSFFFGNPGDIPIAGDFDADGCDTVSVYRPSEGRVYIINELGDGDGGLGAADFAYYFGNPGDVPFTGDFDDDGDDTIGLYRQSTGYVYFRNTHTQGNAEFEFYFGNPGDRFVAGDWTGAGPDTPGVFRPSNATFYLKHTNTQGNADESFPYGSSNMLPVAGDWGDIPAIPDLALQPFATGFSAPMLATAPAGDDRLFVAERGGTIKVVENGSVKPQPFLTVAGVSTCGEGGLLGLAFHPSFGSNGRFFVHYTAALGSYLQSRIVEYYANPASDVASATPVRTILTVDQPRCNHNAGSIAFGPDGNLYIPLGDGGKQGDPDENAQNPHVLLGSVVRIDVDGGVPYAIPTGNPYNGSNGAREVWANGLRNPYRSSIDPVTGDLYIGDVGYDSWEEISVGRAGVAGVNFGWNTVEGPACFDPPSGCSKAGLTAPVLSYPNHGAGPVSVVAGPVYRGTAIPNLGGTFFYADFFDGWIRSFRLVGSTATDQRDWSAVFGDVGNISGFGVDGHGEVLVVSIGGTVYKIVPTPG